jgi:hypothetical protein
MLSLILSSFMVHAQIPPPAPPPNTDDIKCLKALAKDAFDPQKLASPDSRLPIAHRVPDRGSPASYYVWDGKTIRKLSEGEAAGLIRQRPGAYGAAQAPDLVEKLPPGGTAPRGEVVWNSSGYDDKGAPTKGYRARVPNDVIRDFVRDAFGTFTKQAHMSGHVTPASRKEIPVACGGVKTTVKGQGSRRIGDVARTLDHSVAWAPIEQVTVPTPPAEEPPVVTTPPPAGQ